MTAARVVVPDDDDDDDYGEPHALHGFKDGHGPYGRLLEFGGLLAEPVRSMLRTPRLQALAWPGPCAGPTRWPARARENLQAGSAGAALLTLLGVCLT